MSAAASSPSTAPHPWVEPGLAAIHNKLTLLALSVSRIFFSHSCNSAACSRVLDTNDEHTVHTESPAQSLNPPDEDFSSFMRRYQNMVYSTSVRLLANETQAEDISQEVFLKAYENWERLRGTPTAGGWLKTVATNLSINHLQRYRKRWRFFSEFRKGSDVDDPDPEPVEFAAPDTFFEGMQQDDKSAWVEQALAKLPEHQRLPLVLFHFDDMHYDQIARQLGVSLSKVKIDIMRGRKALAQLLTGGAGREHLQFQA